jgi:hypothetical protein
MDLKDRTEAVAENIAWFSTLSPSQKIRALERFKKQISFLRKLQTVSEERQEEDRTCVPRK